MNVFVIMVLPKNQSLVPQTERMSAQLVMTGFTGAKLQKESRSNASQLLATAQEVHLLSSAVNLKAKLLA